jgi:hypothetical protein
MVPNMPDFLLNNPALNRAGLLLNSTVLNMVDLRLNNTVLNMAGLCLNYTVLNMAGLPLNNTVLNMTVVGRPAQDSPAPNNRLLGSSVAHSPGVHSQEVRSPVHRKVGTKPSSVPDG